MTTNVSVNNINDIIVSTFLIGLCAYGLVNELHLATTCRRSGGNRNGNRHR